LSNDVHRISVGIVGTAKNTGKTTVLAALMEEARRRGVPLALTGIGYDGEAIDNLTLLPKPRLDVYEGIHICTAEACVRQATAVCEILETTDEETSLGRVQLVRIASPGRIMLAGPNNTHGLRSILERLKPFARVILIDGALGRMVPMAAADAVIFATGAARSVDIPHLAQEMKAILDIFHLGGAGVSLLDAEHPEQVIIRQGNGETKSINGLSSLLTAEEGGLVAEAMPAGAARIALPGVLSHKALKGILEQGDARLEEKVFELFAPTMLLAGGKPIPVWENLTQLIMRGAGIQYRHPLDVLGVAINPFYPRQIGRRGYFEPSFIDREELGDEFRRVMALPVIDIMRDGAGELFEKIQSKLFVKRSLTP